MISISSAYPMSSLSSPTPIPEDRTPFCPGTSSLLPQLIRRERYKQVLMQAEGSEEEFLRKAGQELLEVEAFFGRVLRVQERYVHVLGNNMMLKQKERPKVGPELPRKCASHKVGLLVCQQMHAKQPTFFSKDYNASTRKQRRDEVLKLEISLLVRQLVLMSMTTADFFVSIVRVVWVKQGVDVAQSDSMLCTFEASSDFY
ncbi:unnamed protein product [Mytilus edulis]|uniref:Uncharacterized protein n=1 Tax=Mytilus edulis TaxID=6550 RepID=A0A8S3RPA0_MYTED|nr:unnamed protein product [Mytilus edulis]